MLAAVGLRAATSGGDGAGAMHAHTDATSLGQPDRADRRAAGRRRRSSWWSALYSHTASDDPIVYPGQPGQSHLHEFFGNTDVDAFTHRRVAGRAATPPATSRSTRRRTGRRRCMRGGEVLTPVKSTAYYRPGEGVTRTTVQPFPAAW